MTEIGDESLRTHIPIDYEKHHHVSFHFEEPGIPRTDDFDVHPLADAIDKQILEEVLDQCLK